MELEHIDVYCLNIPFNVVFRHASAERDSTASLWLEARDTAGRTGLGESCPRPYVTGENLAGAAGFIGSQLDGVKAAVHELDSLREWLHGHARDIDRNPAAWCALELALLVLAVGAILLIRRRQTRLSQTMSYTESRQGRPDRPAALTEPQPRDRRPTGGEPHDQHETPAAAVHRLCHRVAGGRSDARQVCRREPRLRFRCS